MSLSTPLAHLNRNWRIEYTLVGSSKQALTTYFEEQGVKTVTLCYRILSLEEIFTQIELAELASYYSTLRIN